MSSNVILKYFALFVMKYIVIANNLQLFNDSLHNSTREIVGPPALGDRHFLALQVKYNWLYRTAGYTYEAFFMDVTATADIAVKDLRTWALLLV